MEDNKPTNEFNQNPNTSNDNLFGGFKVASGENQESIPQSIPTPVTQQPQDMNLFSGFTAPTEVPRKEETPIVPPIQENTPVPPMPNQNISNVPPVMPVEPPLRTPDVPNPPTPPINLESGPTGDNGKKKKDKSEKLRIDPFLIFIFIIIAVAIFYIPKMSDYMKNGNKKKPVAPTVTATPSPTPTATPESYTKLACASTKVLTTMEGLPEIYSTTINNVTTTKSIVYYSLSDKIKKIDKVTTIDYTTLDDNNKTTYDAQKSKCDSLAKTPIVASGYKLTCTQNENKFIETETYDLTKTDQPITVTIDGVASTVSSGSLLNDSAKKIQTKIGTGDVSCKTVK